MHEIHAWSVVFDEDGVDVVSGLRDGDRFRAGVATLWSMSIFCYFLP
jgi:hypothetical protein